MADLTQEIEDVLDRLAVAIKPMAHHAAIVIGELKVALARAIEKIEAQEPSNVPVGEGPVTSPFSDDRGPVSPKQHDA